jgi:hypothetical protein
MHAIDLYNGSYNWYSHDATSYIDNRVFIDGEWLNHFNDIKVWGLDRSTSDHRPSLIGCGLNEWQPKKCPIFSDFDSKIMMYNSIRNDLKKNWRMQICKWNLFILGKIEKTLSMVEGFSSEHVEDQSVVLLCKCLDVLKFNLSMTRFQTI